MNMTAVTHKMKTKLNRTSTDKEISEFYSMVDFIFNNGGVKGLGYWIGYRLVNNFYDHDSELFEIVESTFDAVVLEKRRSAKVETVTPPVMSHQERLERIIERERLRRSWRPSLPIAVRLS